MINIKCYIMIELIFLKVLMLVRQLPLNIILFVTIGIFLDREFTFEPTVCNSCLDVLMMPININSIAILDFFYMLIIFVLSLELL